MKEVAVLVFYFVLLSGLVYRFSWLQIAGLSRVKLLLLFGVKVAAGLLYVYISKNLIEAGDVFSYFQDSLIVYQHLLEGDFATFLQLTFGLNNVTPTPNIIASVDALGFWWDTSAYMMVRINTLFNVLTFGSGVYANALFFSTFSFLACVMGVKLFNHFLPTQNNLIAYAIFLTPSLAYWTSGMHKESVSVFLLMAVISLFLYFLEKRKWQFLVLLLIAFTLLFCTRFFISVMLIPPMLGYFVYTQFHKIRPLLVFALIFIGVGLTLYVVPLVFNTPNIVDEIISKKELYEALENGNTSISLGVYDESYLGIIKKMPQALFNTIVRPHFLDIKSRFLAIASIESFLISIAVLASFFYVKVLSREKRALVYLLFGFSFSYLLLTGLIVPNLGAILRYRSVAFFVLIPTVVYLLSQKDVLE